MDATPLDATGDYGDATPRSGVNGNGWVARATMPYLAGQTFDPTKISLTVSDPGFDAGGSTTVARTISGGAILRRQYSAQASRQQSNDGLTLTVYFSLTDDIYAGSTVTAAVAAEGFYGPSQAGAINARVNSSTRSYPKPLFAWLNLQHERATGDFAVEAVAYHKHACNGRQVARVEFIGKDSQGTPNVAATQTATTPSLSAFQTKGQIVEAYKATIPVTGLTQGDLCQVNAKIYPWIGDASAVLDLAVDGVAWPSANPQTPLRFLNDKTGGYGGAHAAVKAGAAGGTVQASYAAAVGTPFPTINAALAALPAWNLANRNHNDHSGGTIWLMEDSAGAGAVHTPAAAMDGIAAGLCWTEVVPDPAATGSVVLRTHASTQHGLPSLIRLRCAIDQYRNFTGVTDPGNVMLAIESPSFDTTNALSGIPLNYRFGLTYLRNTQFVGTMNNGYSCLNGFSTTRTQTALALGVVCETATATAQALTTYAMLGCRFHRHTAGGERDPASFPNLDLMDGRIIANSVFANVQVSSGFGSAQPYSARGAAFVQNVLERAVAASSVPALQIGADGTVMAMANIVMAYNTVPGVDTGSRFNVAYTDTTVSAGVVKEVDISFNVFSEYNCKSDTFTGSPAGSVTNTGRVGNWRNRYGVGHFGNVILTGDSGGNLATDANGASWLGEFWPVGNALSAGVANATFTDNKSGTAGTGGGTYTLTGAANAAYDRVPAGRVGLSFDLAGVARRIDGTGAAGAYERTA